MFGRFLRAHHYREPLLQEAVQEDAEKAVEPPSGEKSGVASRLPAGGAMSSLRSNQCAHDSGSELSTLKYMYSCPKFCP